MQALHDLKNMQNKLFYKIYLCILLCVLSVSSYGSVSKSFSSFSEFNKLEYGRLSSAQVFNLKIPATENNKHSLDEKYAKNQDDLGIKYLKNGVNEHNKAFIFFKTAANQGHIHAQCNLDICYEEGVGVDIDAVQHSESNADIQRLTRIDAEKLIEVYGCSCDNWGDRSPFAGDYINYGYWKNIALDGDALLSTEDRIKSSRDLYKEVIQHLDASKDDVVLEIGCGRGVGIADFLSLHQSKCMIGIDINHEQIKRAKLNINIKCVNKAQDIKLFCQSAEHTLLESHSIDKIYSVETAQHFSSMFDFAREMKRLLKPGGKLVFASYFLVDNKYGLELEGLLPLMQERLENIISRDEICKCFLRAGFKDVSYESIGEHVFLGYEKWISQQKNVAEFSHDYFKAYKKGYIDYYIFTVSV